MKSAAIVAVLALSILSSCGVDVQQQPAPLHNLPAFRQEGKQRFQDAGQSRRLGDGFNKPFRPSIPEDVISSNYMEFYGPEKNEEPLKNRQGVTEFYYTPVKSDPLRDDGSSVIRLDTKSKVAYSHHNDDSDLISNDIDIISVPDKTLGAVKDTSFTTVFKHLFEIIQDVLNIMRQMYYPDITEKSDGIPPDTWPLLKNVFLRYLRLVKETDLLIELREIIPVDELEFAIEKEDGHMITQAIIKSINPSMCSFVFNMLHDLVMPLAHFTDNLSVAELREYIPSTPSLDVTWPIRFVVRRSLGIIGYLFSRRELNNMWQEFRSYSPFAARSLEYVLPLEEEEPSFNSVSINNVEDVSEGRLLSNPYFLLAGFGSTVIASALAYRIMGSPSEEETHIRQKRSAMESYSPLMEGNSNIANLVKILETVDPDNKEIERLTQGIKDTKPKKSYKKKFDPLRKLVNYANTNAGAADGPKVNKSKKY